jgi:hypothetical protein
MTTSATVASMRIGAPAAIGTTREVRSLTALAPRAGAIVPSNRPIEQANHRIRRL